MNGELVIDKVTNDKVSLFDGLFILQLQDNNEEQNYSDFVDKEVIIKDIDGFSLQDVESAISIGPNIFHFTTQRDHLINHDLSLSNYGPLVPGQRYGRSIILMDTHDILHLVVLDGAPKAQNFQGVNTEDVTHIFNQSEFKWGYYLDGGRSAKIFAYDEVWGSTSFLRRSKIESDVSLWNVNNGRSIPSAVVLETV